MMFSQNSQTASARGKQFALVAMLTLIGMLCYAHAAQADYSPNVNVTTGPLGDPDIYQQSTCSVSASVDQNPAGGNEADLTAHWSYSIGDVEYSSDGVTYTPLTCSGSNYSDGSTILVNFDEDAKGNYDDTDPAGIFSAIFALAGYYEVQVVATVKFTDDKGTGEPSLGPFSSTENTGYVSN